MFVHDWSEVVHLRQGHYRASGILQLYISTSSIFVDKTQLGRWSLSWIIVTIRLVWEGLLNCQLMGRCRGILIQQHGCSGYIQRPPRSVWSDRNANMRHTFNPSSWKTDTPLVHSFNPKEWHLIEGQAKGWIRERLDHIRESIDNIITRLICYHHFLTVSFCCLYSS